MARNRIIKPCVEERMKDTIMELHNVSSAVAWGMVKRKMNLINFKSEMRAITISEQ